MVFFMSQSTICSHVGIFPGLNQYKAEDKVSCSKTQYSAPGESQTSDTSISHLRVSHCAPNVSVHELTTKKGFVCVDALHPC